MHVFQRKLLHLAAIVFAAMECRAQNAPGEFEVASVKPTAPDVKAIAVLQAQDPLNLSPGGEFSMTARSVAEFIQFAYNVHPSAVAGLPDWAWGSRFDMVAKAPKGASPASARQLMQALLASEFKLAVHTEERPIAAFVLAVGKKGVTVQKSSGAGPAFCRWGVAKLQQDGGVRLECSNMSLTDFAYLLPRFAPGYVNKPVSNMTALDDPFDFTLEFTQKIVVDTGGGGLTVFDALEKQAGLRLQERKVPMPVLVVDHVDRPNGN